MAENTLFLTHDGYPLTGRRIQKILERVGRRAGISERLSPHKLRHTFATWSLKYGSNLEYIRIILGHSDIRTTSKFYLHAASDDVATAHKNFSLVVNSGITGSKEQAVKVRKRGNILRESAPAAGDGNMPVVYSKEKKVRGNNRQK